MAIIGSARIWALVSKFKVEMVQLLGQISDSDAVACADDRSQPGKHSKCLLQVLFQRWLEEGCSNSTHVLHAAHRTLPSTFAIHCVTLLCCVSLAGSQQSASHPANPMCLSKGECGSHVAANGIPDFGRGHIKYQPHHGMDAYPQQGGHCGS